jgi:hypothetical protein
VVRERHVTLLIGVLLALAIGNFASNLWQLQTEPAGALAAPIDVDLPPLASRVVFGGG